MSDTNDIFLVVYNHEMAYSIWRKDAPMPLGWTAEGFRGPRADCLAHIEKVWVDMTPLSLRRQAS
jgi:MbtH protein